SPPGTAAPTVPPGPARRGPPNASENQAEKPSLTPGSRVVAAAYELQKEGKRISLRAACARAGVDRTNLKKRYPEAVEIVRRIKVPDRDRRRGKRDPRTGDIEAVDESED